ncbi:TrkA family potassium uptake protein [Actinotignum urinale]|uniref:potassium channel family protein n=1 Tax=Actinotignum urinale TaxID=190146 RepID=UPI000C8054C1|nr:TrkA family potassium uptake protein [Actinotignum urinale]WIK59086.1 TrkA family potassium uptake protein [Actinotignum urinale]
MHFIIMGCGRVGATLAISLENLGHSVAVIDQNSDAFMKLPDSFSGQQIIGTGFDRDVLRRAHIEGAEGFAAVSNGDNSNIIAARVARETFGLTNVVARVYDPTRATLYEQLGISTVAPVAWASDRVLRRLIPLGPHIDTHDPVAKVSMVEVSVDERWYGRDVSDIQEATNSRVGYIVRANRGIIPSDDTIIQDGDVVHILVPTDDAVGAQHILLNPER